MTAYCSNCHCETVQVHDHEAHEEMCGRCGRRMKLETKEEGAGMTLDEVWEVVLGSGRSIYDKWWLRVDVPWGETGEGAR